MDTIFCDDCSRATPPQIVDKKLTCSVCQAAYTIPRVSIYQNRKKKENETAKRNERNKEVLKRYSITPDGGKKA